MAKENQRKTGGRAKVDARDTFDFTTPNANVVARPTDPYIDQGSANNDTANTIAAIGKTAETYVTAQESMKQGNAKQAQVDQAQGKNASGDFNIFNIGLGYNETWDTMDGEARAISVAADYHKALETSGYFMNSDDPAKERNAAWQAAHDKHFTEGHISEYTKFGAHERLLEAKAKGDLGAFKLQVDLSNQAFASNQMKIVGDMLNRITDPAAIKQGMHNRWLETKDTGAQTHDQNTVMNITAVQTHLNDILSTPPDSMDYAAKSEAAQRILSVLTLTGPDGVAWHQIIDPNTGAPKHGARIQGIISDVNTRLKQSKSEHIDYIQNKFQMDVGGLGSSKYIAPEGETRVTVAKRLQAELYANAKLLPPPFFAAGLAKVQQIIDLGGFPATSDAPIYRDLFDKIKRGSAGMGDVSRAVSKLNEADYDKLVNMSMEESRRVSPEDKVYKDVRNKFIGDIRQATGADDTNITGIRGHTNAVDRKQTATAEAYGWEEKFIAENRRRPTPAEWSAYAHESMQVWGSGSILGDSAAALGEKGLGGQSKATQYHEGKTTQKPTVMQGDGGLQVTVTPSGKDKK